MTTPQLLQEFSRLGVVVEAVGDAIQYRAPVGRLTSQLREQLQAHKAELIQLLTAPPPDILSETPCPLCGSRERWIWLDSRLLCRTCVVLDLTPLTLVREGCDRPPPRQEEVA
jgi:hypothetical protein